MTCGISGWFQSPSAAHLWNDGACQTQAAFPRPCCSSFFREQKPSQAFCRALEDTVCVQCLPTVPLEEHRWLGMAHTETIRATVVTRLSRGSFYLSAPSLFSDPLCRSAVGTASCPHCCKNRNLLATNNGIAKFRFSLSDRAACAVSIFRTQTFGFISLFLGFLTYNRG